MPNLHRSSDRVNNGVSFPGQICENCPLSSRLEVLFTLAPSNRGLVTQNCSDRAYVFTIKRLWLEIFQDPRSRTRRRCRRVVCTCVTDKCFVLKVKVPLPCTGQVSMLFKLCMRFFILSRRTLAGESWVPEVRLSNTLAQTTPFLLA